MPTDIYPAARTAEKKPPLAGYFRSASRDCGLLSSFGLRWNKEVQPLLDCEGRLSPRGAKRLLCRMNERESVFELNLGKLPADDQRQLRGRYALWKNFLNSAIADNAPIYTIV